ncbi:MAG: hypothetical protein IPO78_14130 [Saprospiraceae bacterium]|nr:hypothetical protein [Saprospiraceae bacterium]MBK8448587.1 hypothetical protein [Saprospiraceae bacterium]MBK8482906.1 hypothetical protein [Saprospiraceae bacterium]MBK9722731.1 hypothetical protein [Saprospiraceae bacterium]MBK9726636.1 hypothetical protein [Saprospiraceae bacterium]
MWNINTIWFEIAVVSILLVLGHIFLGHFEERSPKWRKLLKFIIAILLTILLSIYFGRTVAFCVIGIWLIPIFYIHGVLLPRKGINGWTGEPKSKYYEFRGWSKDIFDNNNTKNSA